MSDAPHTPSRLLLVSPRKPQSDGQGDQRRAKEILDALSPEWTIDVVSWLPDADEPKQPWRHPLRVGRILLLALVRPLQVAYVQGLAPHSVRRRLNAAGYERVIFITDRAVPLRPPPHSVIDFIDDLGRSAFRRAEQSGRAGSVFWRFEGWRTQRLDRRLCRQATVAIAHSSADAAGIGSSVQVIPISACTRAMSGGGQRISFVGNLFYAPNDEAARWICTELAPHLASMGVDPARVLIAGRRPHPTLQSVAARAGVELRADVRDLSEVLYESAVVLAPMLFGAGAQYKIIDAAGAERACVLSPVANDGLDLGNGESAVICVRTPEAFGRAIVALLEDAGLRASLGRSARERLSAFMPEEVAARWRSAVQPGRRPPLAQDVRR